MFSVFCHKLCWCTKMMIIFHYCNKNKKTKNSMNIFWQKHKWRSCNNLALTAMHSPSISTRSKLVVSNSPPSFLAQDSFLFVIFSRKHCNKTLQNDAKHCKTLQNVATKTKRQKHQFQIEANLLFPILLLNSPP